MKLSELGEKSSSELSQELVRLNKEHFYLRVQRSIGQLRQTHLLKEIRKDIARVKTEISSRSPSQSKV